MWSWVATTTREDNLDDLILDALAEAISGEPLAHIAAAAGPVRSLVREWRTISNKTANWRMALSY